MNPAAALLVILVCGISPIYGSDYEYDYDYNNNTGKGK